MSRRGFTIVELIIVITIMAILLVLAVVNLRGSQISARDDERKTDITNIALSLERFYTSGYDADPNGGQYPSTAFMNTSEDFTLEVLRDIDPRNLIAPGASTISASFAGAGTNSAQSPTIDQYIYQALTSTGALCTAGLECRKYILYYRLESDNNVYTKLSKNQ